MATQSSAVMEHFLAKKILQQTGMPTWKIIRATHIDLTANAASVPSDLGGGRHCHLGLTIRGAEYQTLTGYAFIRSANPDATLPPGGAYELPAQQ
eukprot:4965971-Ditylum_brightwellii.AAC.1